ncbi:hypothetical protein C8J56DRAFT_1053605 [Mycena floridula]|nr:hypothetical protein C8J56DRAFT_1053605 [Mycena floridula]
MFHSGQRSQSFYQNQVEVLCMTTGLKLHQILSIFSACSNLRMPGMFYWDDEHKSMAELDASLDALAASGPRPSKLAYDLRWTLLYTVKATLMLIVLLSLFSEASPI